MVRIELKWWIWVAFVLIVYMTWKGPVVMEATLHWGLHMFAAVGDGIVRGLGRMQGVH
jgi:hypothetical protein